MIKRIMLVILLAVGCYGPKFDGDTVAKTAGVEIWGSNGIGYVVNKNPFPVRIKMVHQFHGETAVQLKYFEPEYSYNTYNMLVNQSAFYVIDTNGVEIGFVIIQKE